MKMAGAVESAHRLGILHRDVKPANKGSSVALLGRNGALGATLFSGAMPKSASSGSPYSVMRNCDNFSNTTASRSTRWPSA
ncbi:hypothetical protein AXA44_22870 [Rhodococcus sp. SC4]|nr:hypothetical protein AXA44_22870 [Rhodococcus sp. SC4]